MYTEVRGKRLKGLKEAREKEREADLHHIRMYGHPDGSSESPKWLVEHHHSEQDSKPSEYEYKFEDGHQLLAHVANFAAVPEDAHGPSDDLGRQVMPATW